MPTGQIKDDDQGNDTVNLRTEEKVRDLDDLLADAEFEAAVNDQSSSSRLKDSKKP